MMYGSCDIEHNRPNFLLFWTIFCPFTLLKTKKIKILKKWKKQLEILSFYTSVPQIIITWHIAQDMACDRCNCYFSFWGIFCRFTCLKNENFKKWKKRLEISSFYTSVTKIMIIWYIVQEMTRGRCNCYFSFWGIFCLSLA